MWVALFGVKLASLTSSGASVWVKDVKNPEETDKQYHWIFIKTNERQFIVCQGLNETEVEEPVLELQIGSIVVYL